MKCKLCGNKKIQLFYNGRPRRKVGVFIKDSRQYINCQNCFSIYQDLKNFNLKEHSDYFSSGTYSKQVNLKEKSKTTNFHTDLASASFHENVNYLSLFDFKSIYNKKILDYGCGAGNFLKFLYLFSENKSSIKIGIDPIYKFSKSKKIKGIKFVKNFQQADSFCKKYDLITSFSTLCTQPDISDIFSKINKRLKKNGLFIIGDINPLDIRLQNNSYNKIFFRDSCLNYISEEGFKKIAKKSGFKYLKTYYNERYNYENLLNYFSLTKLKLLGINKLNYKKFLESTNQSDYFFITFKKT